MSEHPGLMWLLRAALGGGLVLLLAWWGTRRIESPARRQRLGEWGLVAALLVAALSLAPGWISVPVPVVAPTAPAPLPLAEPSANMEFVAPDFANLDIPPEMFLDPLASDEPALAAPPMPTLATPTAFDWGLVARLVVFAYAAVCATLVLWWLVGHVALWWLMRRRVPPSPRLLALWRELSPCHPMAISPGRRIRLVVSSCVRVPFSCGILRPTVVLPATLMATATDTELRWVLRHECGHLERGDAISAELFGLGRALFFFLPWFWWLRREVRLCQEYLADQAAVGASEENVDYAGFLAGWADVAPLPGGMPAVTGHGSDLFRRITMLLQKNASLEPRCPRRWSLVVACGLLGLAVGLAGVAPAVLAQDRKEERKDDRKRDERKDDRKDDQKKDDRKPDDRKKDDRKPEERKSEDRARPGFFDIDEVMKRLPADLDARVKEIIQRQLEMAKRQADDEIRRGADVLRDRARNVPFRQPFQFNPFVRVPQEGRLGVRGVPPAPALIEQLDLAKGTGIVVEEVFPDSPAAKIGIKVNDILVEIDGKAVSSQPEDLARQVGALEGKTVDIVVLRKGKKETLKGLKFPEQKLERRGEQFADSSLSVQRAGDSFSIFSREGNRTIMARGKLADGKVQSVSITVTEGRNVETYESVEKAPAGLRDEIKSLLSTCEKKVVKEKGGR